MRRFQPLNQAVFVFVILISTITAQARPGYLAVATWNVRQLSYTKMNSKIHLASEDTDLQVKDFVSAWIQDRSVDVLAMQEIYEEYSTGSKQSFHPIDRLAEVLPAKYKIIKGESIRAPIKKGKSKVWREYCPIIFNTEKVNCYSSKDSMVPTGKEYLDNGKEGTRKGHWAYCQTLDKKFDFVFTCLHTNFAKAKEDLIGLQTVINSIQRAEIDLPKELSRTNKDYIFAGDFNLDRKTARAYDRWRVEVGEDVFVLDDIVPTFPKKTRWTKTGFTKMMDVYDFKELNERSSYIYDDVVSTPSVLESLDSKYIDPMIDSYFINKKDRVDINSLLRLSDHLPVIAEYDTSTDTD